MYAWETAKKKLAGRRVVFIAEMMQAEADEVLVGSKLMDRPVRLGSLIISSLIYLQVKGQKIISPKLLL
jgi:hypothetical protein